MHAESRLRAAPGIRHGGRRICGTPESVVTPVAGHPVGPLSGWRPRPGSDWWPSYLLPRPRPAPRPPICSSPSTSKGRRTTRPIELFNGTGAPVDLAAGGYQLELYFNGSTTAGTTIALTGTVADGDVFVFAAPRPARRSWPRPTRPPAPACSTATTRSCCAGRRGGPVVDSIGQVGRRPGHRVGHRADQHRRQHTAPARRR